jgi:excisionase family DNA binding protein
MNQAVDKNEMIDKLRTLSQDEVAKILGCTREYVSRLTNHRNEDRRLPAFAFGRLKRYSVDEVMWWRERHRYVPRRKGKK